MLAPLAWDQADLRSKWHARVTEKLSNRFALCGADSLRDVWIEHPWRVEEDVSEEVCRMAQVNIREGLAMVRETDSGVS